MSARVDQAMADPRVLWALILEDERDGNTAELGEIAERLYVDDAEAHRQADRLRAQVHVLAARPSGR